MSFDTIYVYTDASFSKSQDVAIIGYAIFANQQQHEKLHISEIKLNIQKINESNNIRAEIAATIMALKNCEVGPRVVLYTDCQATCGLPDRRVKLENTNYISASKNKPLVNADLYKEFYLLYDLIKPELCWVKGHSAIKISNIQKNFSYLDKEVRKKMRSVI